LNNSKFSFRKATRLIFGWFLLFLSIPLGIAVSVLSFLLCALFLNNIAFLCLIAVSDCFLVSFILSRFAYGIILKGNRTRFALGLGLAADLVLISLSILTVFKPLVPSSEIIKLRVPDKVEYLDFGQP